MHLTRLQLKLALQLDWFKPILSFRVRFESTSTLILLLGVLIYLFWDPKEYDEDDKSHLYLRRNNHLGLLIVNISSLPALLPLSALVLETLGWLKLVSSLLHFFASWKNFSSAQDRQPWFRWRVLRNLSLWSYALAASLSCSAICPDAFWRYRSSRFSSESLSEF